MNRYVHRLASVLAVAATLVFVAYAMPASLSQVIIQRSATFDNDRPRIGENYTLTVHARNTHATLHAVVRARVTAVPDGDTLLDTGSQAAWVRPGESASFPFRIRCGVEGGTVKWEAVTERSEEAKVVQSKAYLSPSGHWMLPVYNGLYQPIRVRVTILNSEGGENYYSLPIGWKGKGELDFGTSFNRILSFNYDIEN